MQDNLIQQLKTTIKGDVLSDEQTLNEYSHDASLFEVKPQVVVMPSDSEDVKALVKFVSENKKNNPSLSLTARSAGTDMSGGSVNDSIIVSFQKYFNHIISIHDETTIVEPGVFYRDFEKETLKHGLILPSYPASREICALGGIINNNSGGEKSLAYGKTENYIKSLKVVLADSNEYVIKPLTEKELLEKLKIKNFEGSIYRETYKLTTENYELLQKARPDVSKNSAGYFLWNVWDKKNKVFDLTKLFVGAQGTLGFTTQMTIKLVPVKRYSQMLIIFLNDIRLLNRVIHRVLPLKPESFEVYDDHTLKLAIKYFGQFAKKLGTKNIIALFWHFMPEFFMLATGGIPKLILQVEVTGDKKEELSKKISILQASLKRFNLKTHIAANKKAERKYWLIRRESFNLLREKIKNKHTAPFIDDFIVKPECLSEFLPKLNVILNKYPHLIYTIAGHMGDGNFHIIPLMNIENPKEKQIIPKLSEEVYDLVLKHKGSITAEHNDGLIRTPYLKQMYGEKVYSLFEQTKKIFDPQNIFNPRKKVFGDLNFALNHIRTNW